MDRRDDRDAGDTRDGGDRATPPDADGDGDRGGENAPDADANANESRSVASVATEGEEWRVTMDDLERDDELSPGNPGLENTLFVLLGVAFALGVLAQFVVALP